MTNANPGINGGYAGSCVVCLSGTDTGLSFSGDAEWVVAGIHRIGIPMEEAVGTVVACLGTDPGKVPVGRVQVTVRACTDCGSKAGFPVGLIAVGRPIPSYTQPDDLTFEGL